MSAGAAETKTYTGQDVIREALLRHARTSLSAFPDTYVITTSLEENWIGIGDNCAENTDREKEARRNLTALDFCKIEAVNDIDAIIALADRLREIGTDSIYDQICSESSEFIGDDIGFLTEHPDLLPDEGETLDDASFEKYVDGLAEHAQSLEVCARYLHMLERGLSQVACVRRLVDLKSVRDRSPRGSPVRQTPAATVRDTLAAIANSSPLTPDVYVVDVVWPEIPCEYHPIQDRLIDLTRETLMWKIEAGNEAGALVALFDNLRKIVFEPSRFDRRRGPCDMYKAIAKALPESSAGDADEVLAQARRHCDGGEAAEYIRLKRVGSLKNLQSPLTASRLVKSAAKRR